MDVSVLTLIVGTILPIVVGLVTTRVTRAAVKAWLLAGLTLVTTFLQALLFATQSGVSFDGKAIFIAAFTQFIISVAIYYGLWKPTGIAGAAQDVGSGR